jgi:hypothetical protein
MNTHMSSQHHAHLEIIARKLEDVNTAVRAAFESGPSVELVSKSRHHREGGYWGDMMMPQVVKVSEDA